MIKLLAPKLKDEWFATSFRNLDDDVKLVIACNLKADMWRERGNAIFIEALLMFLAIGWMINGGIGKGIVTLVLGMINLGYHLWQRRLRENWIVQNEQVLNWYCVHSKEKLAPAPLYRWMLRKYLFGLIALVICLAIIFAVHSFG
jgi:hypothetical protein